MNEDATEAIARLQIFCQAMPTITHEEELIRYLLNKGLTDFDLAESPDAIKTLVMLADVLNSLMGEMLANPRGRAKAEEGDPYFRLTVSIAMMLSRYTNLLPT